MFQKMYFLTKIFFLLIYYYTFHIDVVSSIQCISFNEPEANSTSLQSEFSYIIENPVNGTPQVETCREDSDSCYVLWANYKNGTTKIEKQGCFSSSSSIDCEKRKCVEKGNEKRGFLYCCCRANLCNAHFSWEPTSTLPTTVEPVRNERDNEAISFYLVYIVFPISMALLLLIMYLLKRRKFHYFNQIPNLDQHPPSIPSTPRNEKLRPIKLDEIKARGKSGVVWKATDKNETVAVKIMPIQEKQAWLTEQEIFKLPSMSHDNILRFIAAEKRGDNLCAEFWLITAYHPLGSMHDYLKSNTITWDQFCHIGYTMAKGLTHLHEEISPDKPAIAHRDFKSSNVLLKHDLTACIADFGLALAFKQDRPRGDNHGQVGTRRYMAPEVLEGAINFANDSFLRMDMYAFGLVLWELASRCSFFPEDPVPEYKLPFEAEVGPHPTLEDMQEVVVQQKRRPIIQKSWNQHPGFSSLSSSIEECWDHDSEARLSASCIMERFSEHMKLKTIDSPKTPLL